MIEYLICEKKTETVRKIAAYSEMTVSELLDTDKNDQNITATPMFGVAISIRGKILNNQLQQYITKYLITRLLRKHTLYSYLYYI